MRTIFIDFAQPSGYSDNKFAQARWSAYAWKAVKHWEIFHGNHLENVADDMYCTTPDPDREYCEPLGWMGRARDVYDVAPHISAPSGQKSSPWIYAGESSEKIMSHLWYQLQLTVNPGSGPGSTRQTPVDWGYQRSHTKEN